ncbi:MAG: DDE-type integrase/transposase/recombinase [Flavobacteriales bacterium]
MQFIRDLNKHQNAQKALEAYIKLYNSLASIIHSTKNIKPLFHKNRQLIVDSIQEVHQVINIDDAIKVFNISRSTFQNWFQEVKFKCSASFFKICCKYNPNQLTRQEVGIIKKMLTDEKFKYWPVNSIALYALRNNILSACVGTWYKYRILLGITRVLPKKQNKKHKKGIRASKPNEIWHADITQFKTIDGRIKYIYFVIDNFSRKILSFRIHNSVCKFVRKDTIVEAYNCLINKKQKIKLILDGGPENNNRIINDFCLSKKNIKKLTALKDIDFSNSMVEATNFLIKYRYIYIDRIKFEEDLIKMMPLYIQDFNAIRPHAQLNGLTPDEVYSGADPTIVSYAKQLMQAQEFRIKRNQNVLCKICI